MAEGSPEGVRSKKALIQSFLLAGVKWVRALPNLTLDAHGDAHAAADAERHQSLFGIALRHFIEQGGQYARTRSADRVADRDRAAVDVNDVGVPAQFLANCQC